MPCVRGRGWEVAMGFGCLGLGRADFRRLGGVAGGLVAEWGRGMDAAGEPAIFYGRARRQGDGMVRPRLVSTGGGRRGKGAGAPECEEIFEGGEQGGELGVDQGEQDR